MLDEKNLKAVVAPELEFYLCEQNLDPDLPLKTPVGKSGRRESGSRVFGIDAVNEFDELTDQIYDYCELMEIGVDTLVHEAGPSQIEINLNHGDPLALADQAFMFKRAVRQVALKHGIHATFMAKPYQGQPGSSMHIHQNLLQKMIIVIYFVILTEIIQKNFYILLAVYRLIYQMRCFCLPLTLIHTEDL